MKKLFLSLAVALSATSSITHAEATTFEDVGTVQNVQILERVIRVNDTFYSLPSDIVIDGEAAIVKLKPGYLVGFSGSLAKPYNRIESLYLYPDSAIEVEQKLKNELLNAEEADR